MSKRWIAWIGLIALAAAPMAMAQEPAVQERTTEIHTVSGRVVEVGRDSLVVESTAGRRMTFVVDRDLTIGADPIQVGDQVRVEYRGETDLTVVTVSPLTAEVERERTRVDVDDDDDFETAPAAGTLPATASPLPMLLLAGISLLGGGFALSTRRRR